MSISKINNNIYFSKSQNHSPSKSLRSFQGKQFSESQDDSQVVTKLSDEDLKILASVGPNNRLQKVSQKTVNTLLFTIPIIDSVATGLVKKGQLSSKLSSTAKTAGKWGAVFAVAASLNAVKRFVNSKSDALDKFNKEHAFASTMIDFAVLYTAFNAVTNAGKNLFEYTKNSFPTIGKTLKNSVLKPSKEFLNNSIINKKIVKPAENYVAKKPYLAGANKITAALLVPTMAIAVLMRYNKEYKNRNENVQTNYNFLKAVNSFLPEKE